MGTGDLDPHTTEVGALMIYVCFVLFAIYGGVGILVGHFADVHDVGVAFCNDPTAFYLIARSVSLVRMQQAGQAHPHAPDAQHEGPCHHHAQQRRENPRRQRRRALGLSRRLHLSR